uniref:Uma2 family endonuclease n=1 Tax=Paractinoplanes polyasparticus TaxID=2856853 RepID=UPI001C86496A|nr:Uma2 family endonuclease [Actinoplanes polyasparticus]
MTTIPDWMRPPQPEITPESAYRDRTVKLRKYAEAGIPNYWRIEHEEWEPEIHTYELDEPTRMYAPTGIHRDELHATKPFTIRLDLERLVGDYRS